MHTNADKENSKDYLNTGPSQSQIILASAKTKSTVNLTHNIHWEETFAQQLALKVYQQRIKNQQLYQKIKQKFQFFDYELRQPLRSNEPESVLIKQYDKLLQERDNLQKEQTKQEYHYQAITKQKSHNYNFLVEPWNHQKHLTAQSNEDRIDRMNKMIVIIKQGIDCCMKKQQGIDQQTNGQLQEKKEQYTTFGRRTDRVQQQIRSISIEFSQKIAKKQAEIAQISKKNQQLIQLVNQLRQNQNKLRQGQVKLYQQINKLSQKIMEKEQKIQELKLSRQYSRKYISKQVDSSNLPIFEIFVKSAANIGRQGKYQSIIIDRKIEEIQEFLSNKSKEYRNSFDVLTPSNNAIQDIEQQLQKDNLGEMSPSPSIEEQNITSLKYYSSTKKIRRPRQLLSGLKQREPSQGMQQLKQMLFIRRK